MSPAPSDEALLAFLVGSVHGTRGQLAISSGMAFLIIVSAHWVAGGTMFFVFALAHALVGFGRIERLKVFKARERAGLTLTAIRACDTGFAFWSTLYGVTLGLTCFELTALDPAGVGFALGFGTSIGFNLSSWVRCAGRPRTLALQVAGIGIPQIAAVLTQPVPHGGVFAMLLAALAATAVVLGRSAEARIVALFKAEEASRRLAQFDALTGLKNRRAIGQAFVAALANVKRRPDGTLAVFMVDLDLFKEINDTLGHAAGDAVIIEAARRLRAAAPGAEVARMGGDEFMVLAPGLDVGQVEALGAAMLDRLTAPFEFEGAPVTIAGSIGAALCPVHGQDMEELMRHADCALYAVKREGRAGCRVFDDSLRLRLSETRLLEIELEKALREDQLEVWHQPIHSLSGGKVRGYEALARWRHPALGLVPPDRFIPLAEQNGAIFRLSEIILEKACRDAAGWEDRRLTVAVNVSPLQFRRPQTLVAAVVRALRISGLEPSRLTLEITESSPLNDAPQTRRAVEELAELGVRFSLDDFGAGYSSLAYLQTFPFSTVKIDRKFVENIHTDRVSSAIVASVCVLAERIHVTVVAEGVETPAQQRALAELGVDCAQGYLYGRPSRHVSPPPQIRLAG